MEWLSCYHKVCINRQRISPHILRSVNSDELEQLDMRTSLTEFHENRIFLFIYENRVHGVLASEIIKNKQLKLSRQIARSCLSNLINKDRICKDSRRRYFPKNSLLNEVSAISQGLNDIIYFVLDPVFSAPRYCAKLISCFKFWF